MTLSQAETGEACAIDPIAAGPRVSTGVIGFLANEGQLMLSAVCCYHPLHDAPARGAKGRGQ